MKRLIKTGIMLVMIFTMVTSAASAASASEVPKDLPEMEQSVLDQTTQQASVSITVTGFIVPLAAPAEPEPVPVPTEKPEPVPVPTVKPGTPVSVQPEKPVKGNQSTPKTGDAFPVTQYRLHLMASAALLFFLLAAKRKKAAQSQTKSPENARS